MPYDAVQVAATMLAIKQIKLVDSGDCTGIARYRRKVLEALGPFGVAVDTFPDLTRAEIKQAPSVTLLLWASDVTQTFTIFAIEYKAARRTLQNEVCLEKILGPTEERSIAELGPRGELDATRFAAVARMLAATQLIPADQAAALAADAGVLAKELAKITGVWAPLVWFSSSAGVVAPELLRGQVFYCIPIHQRSAL
jgi:hypothetical protein